MSNDIYLTEHNGILSPSVLVSHDYLDIYCSNNELIMYHLINQFHFNMVNYSSTFNRTNLISTQALMRKQYTTSIETFKERGQCHLFKANVQASQEQVTNGMLENNQCPCYYKGNRHLLGGSPRHRLATI